MAKLYKTTGEIMDVKPQKGKHFTLKELQGFVSGYIEYVQIKDGREMYVNEEEQKKTF